MYDYVKLNRAIFFNYDEMFAYFGDKFVLTLPNKYYSKLNDLGIDIEKKEICLFHPNTETKTQFMQLHDLLHGSEVRRESEATLVFQVDELPEFEIDDEQTVISRSMNPPYERIFILASNIRKIRTDKTHDEHLLVEIDAESEDKCKQIRDTISENSTS